MRKLIAAVPLVWLLTPSATAGSHEGTWVSKPRSALKIVISKDAGFITGPGWEHRFDGRATILDFEIGSGERFVLRRSQGYWTGEYFHPPIRPGNHTTEVHKMAFTCAGGDCS